MYSSGGIELFRGINLLSAVVRSECSIIISDESIDNIFRKVPGLMLKVF